MRTVVVVDRPGLFVDGLRVVLSSVLPEHRILVASDVASAARELGADQAADLVLIDIDLPGISWDVLGSLRDRCPTAGFLVMSSTGGRAESMRALQNGFDGCITKAQPGDEIAVAITTVFSGRIYIPPGTDELGPGRLGHAAEHADDTPLIDDKRPVAKFTPRQLDILPLLAKGLSNKEIARALKIAEGTIKIHTSSLLRILGARNRTQAAVIAQRFLPQLERASNRPHHGGHDYNDNAAGIDRPRSKTDTC